MFRYWNTYFICILIELRLDLSQISNKRRILIDIGFVKEALIKG